MRVNSRLFLSSRRFGTFTAVTQWLLAYSTQGRIVKGAMGKRINPRLTYSEYVSPDPEQSSAVEMARWDLMDATRRVHRPMLERLSADVFPAYSDLAESGFDFDKILCHPSPHTKIPEGPLKSALYVWAENFHAERDWFLDEILRTLRGWYVAPDWRKSLRSNPIGFVTPTLPLGKRFYFIYRAWGPQLLPWVDYSQKLREAFEKKLSKYEADCRQRAESHGLIPAPRQYDFYDLDAFAGCKPNAHAVSTSLHLASVSSGRFWNCSDSFSFRSSSVMVMPPLSVRSSMKNLTGTASLFTT